MKIQFDSSSTERDLTETRTKELKVESKKDSLNYLDREKRIWNAEHYQNHYKSVLNLTGDRIVRDKIKSHLDEDCQKLFIAGCGSMTNLQESICSSFPKIRVFCGDFAEKALEKAKKRYSHPYLEYRLEDSTHLSFADGAFDAVIVVNSVLSTDQDNRKMFSEFRRILKSGKGKLIAIFPTVNCIIELAYYFDKQNSFREKCRINYVKNTVTVCFQDKEVEQTYYSPIRLNKVLKDTGFQSIEMSYIFLDSDYFYDEEYQRLYPGMLTRESDLCVYENLVVATA